MNWFQRLLKSKISITIVTAEAQDRTKSIIPYEITEDAPLVRKKQITNYRFVEEERTMDGNTSTFYYTQELNKLGDWEMVYNSLSLDKEKAIQHHLKLLEDSEALTIQSKRKVMWEGLTKDEAESWSKLV